MKTTIEITGQINSINRLRAAISTIESEEYKHGSFPNSSVHVIFPSREAAYEALRDANKQFKQEYPVDPMLSYIPKHSLSYDAGRAVILDS